MPEPCSLAGKRRADAGDAEPSKDTGKAYGRHARHDPAYARGAEHAPASSTHSASSVIMRCLPGRGR